MKRQPQPCRFEFALLVHAGFDLLVASRDILRSRRIHFQLSVKMKFSHPGRRLYFMLDLPHESLQKAMPCRRPRPHQAEKASQNMRSVEERRDDGPAVGQQA